MFIFVKDLEKKEKIDSWINCIFLLVIIFFIGVLNYFLF